MLICQASMFASIWNFSCEWLYTWANWSLGRQTYPWRSSQCNRKMAKLYLSPIIGEQSPGFFFFIEWSMFMSILTMYVKEWENLRRRKEAVSTSNRNFRLQLMPSPFEGVYKQSCWTLFHTLGSGCPSSQCLYGKTSYSNRLMSS